VNAPDVIILGGGPAGCATALSLRSYSRSLSIALIEESSYEHPRVGEVLPGLARSLLDNLEYGRRLTRNATSPPIPQPHSGEAPRAPKTTSSTICTGRGGTLTGSGSTPCWPPRRLSAGPMFTAVCGLPARSGPPTVGA
jgi:hypothetical protein